MSDDVFEARILPRRRDGDVEVVHLFNADGTPFSSAGGGGGGSGSGSASYAGMTLTEPIPQDEEVVAPLGNVAVQAISDEFSLVDGKLYTPAGVYLMKLDPGWANTVGSPSSGAAWADLFFVSSDDEIQMAATVYDWSNPQPPYIVHVNYTPEEGYFELRLRQDSVAEMDFASRIIIVKL